jgi:hypothetical protein
MLLVVPYVNFPKKNRNGFIVGKEIGEISQWAYEGSKNSSDSFVTYKNEVYFYNQDQGNIYSYLYRSRDFASINVFLNSIYFDASSLTSYFKSFDIDSNKDFYLLFFKEKMINVYRNSVFIKQYKLPEEITSNRLQTIKVVNKKLILLCTETKIKKVEKEEYLEEVDDKSYLFVLDLDSQQQAWKQKDLKNIALTMDRSEDELAILYFDGSIDIFSILNNDFNLIDKRNINDFPILLTKNLDMQFNPKLIQALKELKIKSQQLSKIGLSDLKNDDKPKKSIISEVILKIKNWKIFHKKTKPATFIARKLHYIDKKDFQPEKWLHSDFITLSVRYAEKKFWWKKPTIEPLYCYLDDDGQLWFNPIQFYRVNHTYSDCHISLLFSKKNHQMVLVENNIRFSYLIPNGKELKILPLTDKDIAGVMKVNFIDPERLVLVKETNSKIPTEPYGLYLFKD